MVPYKIITLFGTFSLKFRRATTRDSYINHNLNSANA